MYEISELTGNIYFDGILVPQDDTTPMWQAYWIHKQSGGKIIVVGTTPEEIAIKTQNKILNFKKLQHQELLPTD